MEKDVNNFVNNFRKRIPGSGKKRGGDGRGGGSAADFRPIRPTYGKEIVKGLHPEMKMSYPEQQLCNHLILNDLRKYQFTPSGELSPETADAQVLSPVFSSGSIDDTRATYCRLRFRNRARGKKCE